MDNAFSYSFLLILEAYASIDHELWQYWYLRPQHFVGTRRFSVVMCVFNFIGSIRSAALRSDTNRAFLLKTSLRVFVEVLRFLPFPKHEERKRNNALALLSVVGFEISEVSTNDCLQLANCCMADFSPP